MQKNSKNSWLNIFNKAMSDHNRWLCIAWAPYSRRSESFARELGGKLFLVHYLRFHSPFYAPFKYILQAVRTLQILFRERPRLIHVMNAPFACGFVVNFYCRLTRSRFVFDHHSDAFASVWRWALPIQKHLARRAITNIVTSQHWAKIIHSWKAQALVMIDPFLEPPEIETFPVLPGFNLVLICIFASDEPVQAVSDAAAFLTDTHIYITGDSRRAKPGFLKNLSKNVTCTGFLPDKRYFGLLQAADAIMALTTRDHTLQLGGIEAIALGKPLIVSDWPYLRQVFTKATVFVPNTSQGIRDGVRKMKKDHKALEKEVKSLRQEHRKEWRVRLEQLKKQATDALTIKPSPFR